MSFPRYPKYKPSGVEWLGEVPEHWGTRPLRTIGAAYGGLTGKTAEAFTDDGPNTAYYIPFTNILNNAVIEPSRLDPVQVGAGDAQNVVHPGDLLFLMSSEDYEYLGFSAVVRNIPPRTFLNSFCKGFRPSSPDALPEYLNYYCRSRIGRALISQLGFGFTRINLRTGALLSIPVLFPPLPEQRAIAAFLDRETAKIDALVAEQERLIELLKEKRQAVISHAVTKGLDPAAPMKPSGVEWLGEVPEHWETGPLKRYWDLTDCKHITAPFVDSGVPVISIREVQGKWIDPAAANHTTEDVADLLEEGGRRLMPGDLVFSRNATVGQVAQVPPSRARYVMGQDVVLLRRRESGVSPDFMQQVIRSDAVTQQLSLLMVGSTFKRVNVEQLRRLFVPWPSHDEQMRIAVFVESCLGRIHVLDEAADSAITLLQERRSALISTAVTGQIDVRNAVSTEAA